LHYHPSSARSRCICIASFAFAVFGSGFGELSAAQPQLSNQPAAVAPPSDAPLTPREREMLEQIRQLADRVRALEARETRLPDPTPTPAPQPAQPIAPPPAVAAAPTPAPPAASPGANASPVNPEALRTWGTLQAGRGFKLARTDAGDLNISGYGLARYLNQLPASGDYVDHLGNPQKATGRNDIQFQRALLWFNGFVYSPKLTYEVMLWTVNSVANVTVAGKIGYSFSPALNVFAGIGGLPGIRSMTGAFPYFMGTDRVMAEEFFRPGFTSGAWAAGALSRKTRYVAMVGNNLSQIGLRANQLTRDPAFAASFWWMPTTGEFGDRGGLGDYERHEKLATRFGFSYTHSREDRGRQPDPNTGPENTTVRLSDGGLFFAPGSLGANVTVQKADFNLYAMDAGLKYRGFALHGEGYLRSLDNFAFAQGSVPYTSVRDRGFYVQSSYTIPTRLFEFYGVTSWIFGQMGDSHEYGGGVNYRPFHARNFRVNAAALRPYKSPVSSLFGYYVGGQKGTTLTLAADFFF